MQHAPLMASASTRAITPTHTGNFAQTTVAPDTPTSISSDPQAAPTQTAKHLPHTQLSPAIANTSLRASESPKSPRTISSTVFAPLTGAAAMAEQRQLREKQHKETSPNPGTAAIQTLLGQGTSNSKDAPAAVTNMSDPLAKVAKSIKLADKNSHDPAQTSPISMSSLGSLDTTTAPTATAMESTAGPLMPNSASMSDDATPKASAAAQDPNAAAGANDAGNRAFTFPPPLDQDPRNTPQRGMSLPMSYNARQQGTPQTRSPSMSTGSGSSTKRHKCPYCSTDFTRHHNLKSHLLTHSREKPYECPTCNARFRRLHDLKRHTKLHTGERPHTCPKCGRRFARGDALARHGKGVGGCAGRRSSFGAPGSGGDDDGEGMEGLEYSGQQTEEPERMDEDEAVEGDRRRSEPSREMLHHRQGASASTYPPVQGANRPVGNSARAMYPPPQASMTPSNTTTSTGREQSGPSLASAQSTTGSTPSMHFPPQQSSVFGQPGITESPKPLSPGQEAHRSSLSEASVPGGRSLTGYTRSRGSSSVSLHPNPAAPQLPSLPGLNPSHAPSMLHQSMPAPQGSGSNPGSHSSHGQSSGSSLREVLGGGPSVAPDVWSIVRDLEGRLARMGDEYGTEIRRLKDEYGGEIRRLNDEVGFLRAQLGDASGGREPPPPQAR